jgi:hypothetical protein
MPLSSPYDHDKYLASASQVRKTCRSICELLEGFGFQASTALRRDGFSYIADSRQSVAIDPKGEWLRLKVQGATLVPPPELLPEGLHPEWLIVRPSHEGIALHYLTSWARPGRV